MITQSEFLFRTAHSESEIGVRDEDVLSVFTASTTLGLSVLGGEAPFPPGLVNENDSLADSSAMISQMSSYRRPGLSQWMRPKTSSLTGSSDVIVKSWVRACAIYASSSQSSQPVA
eukprot:CAMPEP_0184652564 /NCGR_PEP_ID=MMETSP0308-20130426/10268_1 /TAXON_ID=38269 /ORGANISM="Gloeochaete witrockiana, Strain SAG 46.84" /LENGTH=115 /DNA_ID=CAMNT_0027087517 /DNA_START=32 /DNA_END=379 /DNA_ORIENTATION=-